MIKSRKIRRVKDVARIRERGIHATFWWENQKERDH
jgi:hypothetical protein